MHGRSGRVAYKMVQYEAFKVFLKHNLMKKIHVVDFDGTLIDAHNLGDEKLMMRILDKYRETALDWWVHYDGPRAAWKVFQSNYTNLNIVNQVVPSDIIPIVREIESNQLSICIGKKQIFCSSCFRIRSENALLKLKLSDASVTGAAHDDPDIGPLVREWFTERYHFNGIGRGYPRRKLRVELQKHLSSVLGYRADLSGTSSLWKWFITDVIKDKSTQYRGFRIWKKTT